MTAPASDMPLISVVMPAYNAQAYIAQAIESILKQSFTDYEFIIVDDGSTDRTAEVIRNYAERDSRILFVQGQHGGVSAALNLGLERARAPWIAIMHADDVALRERLERQHAASLTDHRVVIWGTNGYHIGVRGRRLSAFFVGPTSHEDYIERRQRFEIIQCIHPTAMLRRDIALKVGGYNSDFDAGEDIDLFERMLEYGELRTLDEPLIEYRVHANSLSMQHHLEVVTIMRFVEERQRRRLQGQPLPEFAAFVKQSEQVSFLARLRVLMQESSRLNYRSAGLAVGDNRYVPAAYHLTLALLFNPRYATIRVWRQVFSARARQRLNANPD
jgi:glycosyltransferase involved in cell wall biosynthesis